MDKTSSKALEAVRQSRQVKVKVLATDIDGVLRGKYMAKEKSLSAVEGGFGFCDVIFGWDCHDALYDNTTYTGWHTGYPDAQSRIDLNTARQVPWDDDVFLFLADFVDSNGQPLGVCPRQVLKKVITSAERLGYEAIFALEFEWFNFKETPESIAEKKFNSPTPITPGMFGYSELRSSYNQSYFSDIFDCLTDFGVPLEGLHTETGPGVYEAAIIKSHALEAADRGVLFKTAVKEIAYRHEVLPSFMAKWNASLPGCGGHLHQSLWDKEKKTNCFFAENDPQKMSPIFKSYLAGQLALLPELLLFYAPNINSYKRLVEGHWAPTRATWGIDNRTTALRVIPGSASSTRLETRVSGSDINPYLAVAAALASGLYGIENKLTLDSPAVIGNAYQAQDKPRFAANLGQAIEALEQSKVAREFFGETFVEHFLNTRRWEWRQYQNVVTSWELERYFELT